MAEEKISKIYGRPNFKLILAMFVASIVVLLVLGWLFLRSDVLNLNKHKPATGMTILYQAPLLR